jgi:predicted amidohydrolase
MKIGFIQFNPHFGEKEENVERALSFIKRTDAGLLVLPELFNSGYLFTSKEEAKTAAETVPEGFTTRRLIQIAAKQDMFIVAGLAEVSDGAVYNSAVLVGPDGHIGTYRKAHLFKDEPKWFAKGNTPFQVYEIGPARIGMMICFDWIFPEVARTLALKGADILCHPSNLMLPYCQKAMVTRCLENRIFAITCNRIGCEDRGGERLEFTGLSEIVDPTGNVLSLAGHDEEKAHVVEIDPLEARRKQVGVNRIFEERRTDLYEL